MEVLNIILEWWHDVALGLQWSWCQEVSPYMHACMRDEAFYEINSCMRPRAGKGVTYSSGENKIVWLCLLLQQNMNLWIDHTPFFWLLFLYYSLILFLILISPTTFFFLVLELFSRIYYIMIYKISYKDYLHKLHDLL